MFCVTTPFTLPYGVMLAARLRGAATVLLIYDLYPEALQAAGLAQPSSLTARLIRRANAALFRRLDTIITIGRDVAPLLLAYPGVAREKIHFIPNWTLLPCGYRTVAADNRFRGGPAEPTHRRPVRQSRLHPSSAHCIRGCAPVA